MKCMYYIGILLCLSGFLKGQSISKEVVSITGDFFTKENYGSLEGTLGELSVSFMEQSHGALYEGFHHPSKKITTKAKHVELTTLGISTRTFPNPVIGTVNIEVSKPGQYTLELLDGHNRVIRVKSFQQVTKLDVGNLPAAIYFIRIRQEEKYSELHKLIKL